MFEVEARSMGVHQGKKIYKGRDQANCGSRTLSWKGKDERIEKKHNERSGARVANYQTSTSWSNWGLKVEFLDGVGVSKRKARVV